MAREETLFHPIPQQRKTAATAAGPALRMEIDPDEERESLLETMTFASRAARRRKPLTVLVLVAGLALTMVAEYLAPRTYEVEARVLVLRRTTPSPPTRSATPRSTRSRSDRGRTSRRS